MHSTTYSELLQDPSWQKKRLEIMDRDGWKCRECNSGAKTLNVHHHVYRRGKSPWEYSGIDLITFCHDCHEERHEKIKTIDIAFECLKKQTTTKQLNNLERAMMFKGPSHDALWRILNGEQ